MRLDRKRQDRCEQRNVRGRARVLLDDEGLEAPQPLLGRLLAAAGDGALERRDDRVERAVHPERGTVERERRRTVGPEPVPQHADRPALADPRLAGEEHDATAGSLLGELPVAQQLVDLGGAADERRQAGPGRGLEPVVRDARPEHAVDARRASRCP